MARLVPAALLALGLVSVLLLTIPTEDVKEAPGSRYGIVVDAGSSHTALFVYVWPADKQNGTGVVTQHSECHVKGGGISSYADERGGAGRSLESCLDQATQDVPKDRHALTPIYLGATAGMRLLNKSRPEAVQHILQEVKQKIQTYPFQYRGASILSGQEEGAYGWVTVNYLLENFIKYGFVGRWFRPGRPTVGALDLGGASTQITFSTTEPMEDERDRMRLRLYGQDYTLYTHSYLCYGLDQVLRRLLLQVYRSQAPAHTLTHPCYPVGHSRDLKLGAIFSSPCTAERPPDGLDPEAPVRLRGGGDYRQCLGNVTQIFSFGGCSFSSCSFDRVFQPNVSGSFMAFSAFFYITSFLQRVTGITPSSPSLLEEASRRLCNMNFSEMMRLAPDQTSRLQDYCASSVFITVLTLRGYGFDDTSFSRISFQKKAGDTSVGWALGYMLSLSNLLPAETPRVRKALVPGAWWTLVCLFALLLVGVVAFVFHRARDTKKKGSSESPL